MDTAHTPLSILIVEDNDNLRESIIDALGNRGHHVRGLDCAEALPEQANLAHLDLAILDLNLPGEDGLSLAKRLRASHPDLGIIMLTARVDTEERAIGYAHGADIYLSKPASLNELEAAIRALTRRLKPASGVAQDTACRINPSQRTLALGDGQLVSLSEHESSLLVAFIRAPQHTLATWQIAEIFGMKTEQLNKPALELHIVRLRKKLPMDGSHSPIQAVRGHGYRLCLAIRVE